MGAYAVDYLTYSWMQTFLFIVMFVVLLRGFLGLYQDLGMKRKTGVWHFAWFKLGKNKGTQTDEKITQE